MVSTKTNSALSELLCRLAVAVRCGDQELAIKTASRILLMYPLGSPERVLIIKNIEALLDTLELPHKTIESLRAEMNTPLKPFIGISRNPAKSAACSALDVAKRAAGPCKENRSKPSSPMRFGAYIPKTPRRVLPLYENRSKSGNTSPQRFGSGVILPRKQPDGIIYPVWFGTNRKREDDGYLGEKHSNDITMGRAEVFIPRTHRFGESGTQWWKKILQWASTDDSLKILKLYPLNHNCFYTDINGIIRSAGEKGETHALVFIHGYNVTFEDAILRAAQIGADLKVPGATAVFSWPSCGSTLSYAPDEAAIERSEEALTAFLIEFCSNCRADKIHMIAHSMGNRGLMRSLIKIANTPSQAKLKLDQIILAAPDVDHEFFKQNAILYTNHAKRTTLYASDADLAVWFSGLIHKGPRAGYYTPYTVVDGIDTVAVPDFDVDILGHSYYAKAEPLLNDMHILMRTNDDPNRRLRTTPVTENGETFWKLTH